MVYKLLVISLATLFVGCNCDQNIQIQRAILPADMAIHPFSNIYGSPAEGIDLRLEVLDKFGDSTKAYGKFRFEAYSKTPRSNDPRGKLLASWSVDLGDPDKNFSYWDRLSRSYRFDLTFNEPAGKFDEIVMEVIFDMPEEFKRRLFITGQVKSARQ